MVDATGQRLGPKVRLNTDPTDMPGSGITVPSVASQPNGDFVVVWANAYSDTYGTGSYYGVWGRRVAVCGNGRATVGLSCDDGNDAPDDGCSADCDVETCHTCDAGEPSTCAAIGGCTVYWSTGAGITDKATLTIGKTLAPAGDETLTFKGASSARRSHRAR